MAFIFFVGGLHALPFAAGFHPEKRHILLQPTMQAWKIWYNSCETVCIIRQLSAGAGDQKIVEHFFDLMEESIGLLIGEA